MTVRDHNPMEAAMASFDSGSRGPLRIVAGNIRAHFHFRKTSWFMAALTFGVGLALSGNPTLLASRPDFVHLLAIAPQPVWQAIFLIIGTSRLLALAINGSFPGVDWTPRLRMAMSAVSALAWSQVAWSVLTGDLTLGSVIYPMIVVLEVDNMFQAAREAGRGRDGQWH